MIYGMVSLFYGISTFMGFLCHSHKKNSTDTIYPITETDKEINTFSKTISLKVNVIA